MTERIPGSLLTVTQQVVRKVGTQIMDCVAPEPGFSTLTLLCLSPQSPAPLKLTLEAHSS